MFLQANSLTLHVLDHGGRGPVLVLMHGLSANAHCFDGLVAAGLTNHFHVYSVDLRGRGQSDKPATGYTMADHSADIIGLLDALGFEQVILGGHSFGGLLTLYTAAHYPERVSRLLVLDAAGKLHPDVRDLLKPSLARLEQTMPSWEAFKTAMQAMPFLHGTWDEHLEAFYRADVEDLPTGEVKPRANAQAIWQAADLAIDEPWDDYLAQIQQPTLLIRAPENYGRAPVLLEADARATVSALAHGRYAECTGNHMTMLFAPHAAGLVAQIASL